ncbi:MAG: hypothetical protein R3A48_03765 [Polyangiales bacterium]
MLGPGARQHLGSRAMWLGACAIALASAAGHAVFTRRAERAS